MQYYFGYFRHEFQLNRREWILRKFVELGAISKNKGWGCENVIKVRKNWYYFK